MVSDQISIPAKFRCLESVVNIHSSWILDEVPAIPMILMHFKIMTFFDVTYESEP